MTTAILSYWRNDAGRDLEARMGHLLQKTGDVRWIWVVGDSEDETEATLRRVAGVWTGVTVLRYDHADLQALRLTRFSAAADAGLAAIEPGDARVLIHESDLRSPRNIVERLTGSDREAVAGWPTLTLHGRTIFYDTAFYRAQGRCFEPTPPYHPVYRPDARFEVASVGSCWSLPAWAVRDGGARCQDLGAFGLCTALRERGIRILVDPRVPIVQPAHLWTPALPPREVLA